MKIKSRYIILFICSIIINSSTAQTSRKTKEILVSSVSIGGMIDNSFTVSNDFRRVAYRVKSDNRQVAVVDNIKSSAFDYLSTPVFSPDNLHFAFSAQNGSGWFLVVDNKIEQSFVSGSIISLQFSPDSWSIACIIKRGDKFYLNVDGIDGKGYDFIDENSITFSSDSKELAYTAGNGDKQFNVIENEEGPEYEKVGFPIISTDGKHLAYWAVSDNQTYVVLDNKESYPYEEVSTIIFNQKGTSCAYQAVKNGKQIVIQDGIEGEPYEVVHSLQFSPDGSHLIYAAETEEGDKENFKQYAILNGKKLGPYETVVEGGIFISPDGKQIAFKAERHDEFFMVINGQEGKHYTDILQATITYSNDNKLAFAAESDYKRLVNANGVESTSFNDVYSIKYSPDNNLLAYTVRSDNKEFVVVNGKDGKYYDTIMGMGGIHFDSRNSFHYMTMDGDGIYLVEETVQ